MLDVNRLDGVYDQPYIFIHKQIHDAVTFHENKSRVVRVFPMRCSYDAFLLYFPHFISTFFFDFNCCHSGIFCSWLLIRVHSCIFVVVHVEKRFCGLEWFYRKLNILNVFLRAVKIVIKINSAIKDKIKTDLYDHWIEYDHPLTLQKKISRMRNCYMLLLYYMYRGTYVIFCFFLSTFSLKLQYFKEYLKHGHKSLQ